MMIRVPLVPPSPNELRRKYRHPHAYRKLRKLWEAELLYGASCSRHRNELIALAEKSIVTVQITVHHTHAFDMDNLMGAQKVILDALRNIHFLANDDAKHLQLLPPEQVIGKEKYTLVVLR